MKKIKVIKIGGKLIENRELLTALCDELPKFYPNCVLVHGGGTLAGELATRLGLEVKMHEGRRITDSETLKVTVMAYAGLANKTVVAELQKRGVNACGVSGCDMGIVVSHKRPVKDIDWGYVGDIDSVNCDMVSMLLEQGIMPVFSPITFSKEGDLLNTNADSVANAVASALAERYEVELTFCFDKPGVLMDIDDDNSAIPSINREQFKELKESGVIYSGMLPKLENAFKTIDSGVAAVRLTNPSHLDGGTVIIK
jgi:acetylglutamate kinase